MYITINPRKHGKGNGKVVAQDYHHYSIALLL